MLVVIGALLAVTALPQDAFTAKAWGRFSRHPMLAHSSETVEIATDGKRHGRLEYRLRLTRRWYGAADEMRWADSGDCPAVRLVIARLRGLQPPEISPPGFDRAPLMLVIDGIGYDMTAPTAQGRISWSSNVGTVLAAFVDDSLQRLEPCWKPLAP